MFAALRWSAAAAMDSVSAAPQCDEATTSNDVTSDAGCGCGANTLNRGESPAAEVNHANTAAHMRDNTAEIDPAAVPAKLVWVPRAEFTMGHNNRSASPSTFEADGEGPARRVAVSSFWIAETEVSVAQWAAFAEATGFVTESERFGWSFVFDGALTPEANEKATQSVQAAPWWIRVDGASWRAPDGPGSDALADRPTHPVSHVAYTDSLAYCRWAYDQGRLPSEAEWERAARGDPLSSSKFPWGNALVPKGTHRCNVWQGVFPRNNTRADGHILTAPIFSFGPQNNLGLYNIIGNVWEWVADYWTIVHQKTDKVAGPALDPQGPAVGSDRTKKGGSYMCHKSYCNRYRIRARSQNSEDTGTGNLGFRCARSATASERTPVDEA